MAKIDGSAWSEEIPLEICQDFNKIFRRFPLEEVS